MKGSLVALVLIPLLAVIAPVLASLIGRIVKIPLVVFEIVLGILVGPSLLGWVHESTLIGQLANFGLAMLFFMAGNEIDFARIRGRSLNRAAVGWLISLAVGIIAGVLLAPNPIAGIYIGIALTTTALGTLMPILRDAGELSTPFGRAATAVGAAGEFGPLLAISLFLSGRAPLVSTLVLIAFVVIAGLAIWLGARGSNARMHGLVEASLHTSGQFAVRLVILIVLALVSLSLALGLDMLMGAFAAGVLFRVLLGGADAESKHVVEGKLEAVAFGFLVPIFFINTGVTFDLKSLISDPHLLLLLPIFLVLFLIVRGLPSVLAVPKESTWADRRALLFLGATGLPLIVAVTDIGVDEHNLTAGTAAALVGAGMLSVLVFPLVGLAQRARSRGGEQRPPDSDDDIAVEA